MLRKATHRHGGGGPQPQAQAKNRKRLPTMSKQPHGGMLGAVQARSRQVRNNGPAMSGPFPLGVGGAPPGGPVQGPPMGAGGPPAAGIGPPGTGGGMPPASDPRMAMLMAALAAARGGPRG